MSAALERELETARAQVGRGDLAAASASYARALALAPDQPEALSFLGVQALNAGHERRALELLARAVEIEPANAQYRYNAGFAYLSAGRLDEARRELAETVALAPKLHPARLHYARTLEQLGREHEALVQYFAAINRAQAQGRWLNDATTAPALRELVRYAMGYVDAGRRRVFDAVLAPFVERHGEAALARTRECLHMYLGDVPTRYADPRQKPKFLYFPGVPATTYYDRALFPWYEELEANTAAIRDELLAVMASDRGLEPFLGEHSVEQVSHYLAGAEKAAWDAFFFYRHGERYDENCARCPRTAALLDAMPLVRIREHAPEVCFSVLTPGTHILPHRGVTNTRLVTHLPLIVPGDCAINVGGELHAWEEGRCITFDDTFEHEAWNRSTQTRVVMLLDVWNPHLTDVERDAVSMLVAAIGEFNREWEDLE